MDTFMTAREPIDQQRRRRNRLRAASKTQAIAELLATDATQNRPPLPTCPHARTRMNARRVGVSHVELAIDFGRELRQRGALMYVVGRKEIDAAAREGIDLRPIAGVHVVCSPYDGTVKTVYRNQQLQLQPGSPWRPQQPRWQAVA